MIGVVLSRLFAHHAQWQRIQRFQLQQIQVDVLKFLLPIDVRLTMDVERNDITNECCQTKNTNQRTDVQRQGDYIETTGMTADLEAHKERLWWLSIWDQR